MVDHIECDGSDDGGGDGDDSRTLLNQQAHNRGRRRGREALSRNGNWGPGGKRAPQKGTRSCQPNILNIKLKKNLL